MSGILPRGMKKKVAYFFGGVGYCVDTYNLPCLWGAGEV